MGTTVIEKLIDSVILIDHLNGFETATKYVLALTPSETAISVITRAEILVGVAVQDEALVKAWLDQYHLLNLDKAIADLAATLRRQSGWKLPDAFQAAFCVYYKIKLVTRNTKDFDPRRHGFVEIPYHI
jgi:predicted nucleic acid-binding protein